MQRRIAWHKLDLSRQWDRSVQALQQRLGGVRLADLEDGDEQAARIAERSLRKEWMKMMTADAERRENT